jgi:signal peptidase I
MAAGPGYDGWMKSADELRRERRVGIVISVAVLTLGLTACVGLKFVTGFSRVGGGSMAPTIHRGDRVAVNRLAYVFDRKPRVGDVASYWTPLREHFIHRIVAGPGDTLEMRDNVVFRNGKRLDEPYVMLTPDIEAIRNFGPVTVPPGHYFFLGDNRDNANDSRFLGFIPEDDIRGRMGHVLHIGECSGTE